MFHDGVTDWDARDRQLELADACVACERHVSVCRCNVRNLPRLRVARPMPAQAGDVVKFPVIATGRGGNPDLAA